MVNVGLSPGPATCTAPIRALLLIVASALAATTANAQPAAINRILFDPQPLSGAPVVVPAPRAPASPATMLTDSGPGAEFPVAQGIDSYLQSIAATELDGGPFAPELLEQYFALGDIYQQRGDHEEALAAYDKADYISRITLGLYSPEQFAIVEGMIESHLARGEVAEAQDKQQYLLFLNREYYGDSSLQVVPALETLGDWNLDAFRAMLNQANPSNLIMQLRGSSGINADNPRMLAFSNLQQARMNYRQAIANMLGHQQFGDPRLIELEQKMVETEFLSASRDGIMDSPEFYIDQRRAYTGSRISRTDRGSSGHFINGRNAYRRIRLYQENLYEVDPLAVAQTIIDLGDWNLLFQRQVSALNHYREARRYMTEHGVPEAAINDLLSPPVPRQLPVFTPLPHSRAKFGLTPDADIAWDGHIDVHFHISRFGNVSGIEVLERTEGVTDDIERRLRRLLHSSPFRPRFVAGDVGRGDEVTVRYYFAQID